MIGRHTTYIVFLIASCSIASAQVAFFWQPRAPLPSGGRWAAMTFSIDGKGYVVGGHNGSTTFTDMWMYDPDLDQWTPRAPLPAPRRFAGSFALNGKGYVVCGLTGTSTMHQDLYEYDPAANSWSVRASFPGTARYGVFSFALNGQGYVGSGNTGSGIGPYVSDCFGYDPATNAWSPKASLPGEARYGTTSFVTGGKGYVHGGRVASLAFTNDLWEYDALANTWLSKPAMNGPGRSWAMSMPFDFDAVVACGKDEFDMNLYDAYRYMPSTDTWTSIPNFPGNSGWSGASFTFGDRVFGGLGRRILSPNAGYFNDWWELVKVDATAISEPSSRETLRVYPNPLSGGEQELIVDYPGTCMSTSYTITDAMGKAVIAGSLGGRCEAVAGVLAPGLYYLCWITHAGVATAPFVIE